MYIALVLARKYIPFALISLFLSGCSSSGEFDKYWNFQSNERNCSKIEQRKIVPLINNISTSLLDTSYFVLQRNSCFEEIENNPLSYVDQVLNYLRNNQLPKNDDILESKKTILVLAMHKLPFESYFCFASELVKLRKLNIISSYILEQSLSPGFDWNVILQLNYRDHRVQHLLKEIRDLSLVSKNYQIGISLTLDGTLYADIKEQVKRGELPLETLNQENKQ